VNSIISVKNLTQLLLLMAVLASCRSLQPLTGQQHAAPTHKEAVFLENVDMTPSMKNGNAGGPVLHDGEAPSSYPIKAGNGIEDASNLQFKYSILLNDEVERVDDTRLLAAVDEWYGVRYRYGGTSKTGIDCSGFTSTIYQSAYRINLSRISTDQYKESKHVSREELKEGDLVFFNIRGRGVSHVGIYLRNNKFIHASLRDGVRVDDLSTGFYHDHFVSGGRVESRPEPSRSTVSSH
jgi:cell wall-associated NlpC family hydrolase